MSDRTAPDKEPTIERMRAQRDAALAKLSRFELALFAADRAVHLAQER